MIPKKDPASLASEQGFQTTFANLEYSACEHARDAMVRINCGAGGVQYRKFCTTCWSPIGSAIAHALAHAEEARSGVEAPFATLEIIHAAQDCYARREQNGGWA